MKRMMECPDCGGIGTLPPLGFAGLPGDDPERLNVKRHFPRACDMCNGEGRRLIEVSVEEKA